mgnify:CR=1 FL=1
MSYVVWVLCWVLLLSFKTSHYDSSHSSLVLVAIVSLILVVIVSLILVNIASLCSSQRCVRYSCLQDAKNLYAVMYKVLRKNFVYRWRRPKELPLIYKKRRSNPMIGTPLFLNNFNYTHTIENVNKIICTFLKTLKINNKKSR